MVASLTLAVVVAVPAPSATAARPPSTAAAPVPNQALAAWSWPVQPSPTVVRPFVAPPERWSPGHRGVDLGATAGGPVLAPAAGLVTFAGRVVDRGVVVVTHPGGLRSSFEPVTALVPVGTPVARGQPVAAVEASPGHCGPMTCLHWGVRRGETYLDPARLVRGYGPAVLLPLGEPRRRSAASLVRGAPQGIWPP